MNNNSNNNNYTLTNMKSKQIINYCPHCFKYLKTEHDINNNKINTLYYNAGYQGQLRKSKAKLQLWYFEIYL